MDVPSGEVLSRFILIKSRKTNKKVYIDNEKAKKKIPYLEDREVSSNKVPIGIGLPAKPEQEGY